MKNRHLIAMSSFASSLILIGAGCGSGQVAIPAGSANGETALSSATGVNLRYQQDSYDAKADAAESASAPSRADTAPAAAPKTPRPTAFPGVLPQAEISGKIVRIVTPKGEIVFELLDGEAPKTVSNFVALAKSGFYDGLTFHRWEPGFVIQGGDPEGTGRGGPGYRFEDEPVTLNYDAGIVAMANAGPNTNGSQFFIMLEDVPLDKLYTIFGRVLSGMETVQKLRVGDRMTTVTVEDRK